MVVDRDGSSGLGPGRALALKRRLTSERSDHHVGQLGERVLANPHLDRSLRGDEDPLTAEKIAMVLDPAIASLLLSESQVDASSQMVDPPLK